MNLANLMIANQVSATPDTLTLAEKAIEGIQVVAIGMGVVFGVLILLIGILQVFKLFALKKPKEEKVNTTTAPAAVSAPVSVASQPVTVSASASEEEALVAIATAAIAASRGESECAFNVISIKKIVK